CTLRDSRVFPTRRSSDLGLGVGGLIGPPWPIGTARMVAGGRRAMPRRAIGAILPIIGIGPGRDEEKRSVALKSRAAVADGRPRRSEEHTSELQSRENRLC